jgi:DNA polymerase-3 subunit delta
VPPVPLLSISALDKQVASRKLPPVLLFVGDDVKLMDRKVDAIEDTVDAADRPFAVERIHAGDPGGQPVDIAASARIYPMLGDRRIVIVLRAERLLKPKRAARATDERAADDEASAEAQEEAADLAPLEEYLESPSPSTTLVFVATEVDRTRRFTKRLLAAAHLVHFGGLMADGPASRPRAAALEIIQQAVTGAGRSIDPGAARMLAERVAGDITRLRSDLERLLLYTEGRDRISLEDALEVASTETTVEDEWAVVNAIGDGDAARALREVARRLDRGDSVFALLGQLRWWVSSKLATVNPRRVRPAVDALLRTDLALKSSGGDERVLIERLIVELAAPR